MSSFNNPHHFFLFDMTNGKRKLAYGSNAEDAYENLRLRLSDKELATVDRDHHLKITQRELRQHSSELG